ncbi:MAG: hypothetical protein LBQ21_00200 [Clostridiales Family XIII bacterium]|jgi:hypothetical protein|nr:hypothetical protein [Clostridiales Family XIII bacterium]
MKQRTDILHESIFIEKNARRLLAILIAATVILSGFSVAFAETQPAASVTTDSRVVLSKTQTDFTVPITMERADAYAGVELAIQCGEGVTIKSVSYSKAISKAGPEEARGLTWFSVFSGDNDYKGKVTATVRVNYTGTRNTSMVVDHAAFYSIDGGTFHTENVPLRKKIAIDREGANNTVPPLDPPEAGDDPGVGNPPVGTPVDHPPASSSSKGSGNSNSDSKNRGTASANAVSTDTVNVENDEAVTDSANEQITSGDIGNTDPNPSSEDPRAGGIVNTNVPNGDMATLNMALLVLTIVCLTAVVTLGFLLIKSKRRERGES